MDFNVLPPIAWSAPRRMPSASSVRTAAHDTNPSAVAAMSAREANVMHMVFSSIRFRARILDELSLLHDLVPDLHSEFLRRTRHDREGRVGQPGARGT
jgi:hypothetical protein